MDYDVWALLVHQCIMMLSHAVIMINASCSSNCLTLTHYDVQEWMLSEYTQGMASTALATSILVSGGSSSRVEVVFFYISLYLVSIGCGGFQPNLQSLGADQFDTEGEKATFFTRYLVLNNLGIALGDTVIVYIVTAKGWVFGFSMCTIVGLMGLTLFLCGFPLFRQYKNNGNPYTRALQVIVAAVRKWRLELPSDSSLLYEEEKDHNRQHLKHTDNLR